MIDLCRAVILGRRTYLRTSKDRTSHTDFKAFGIFIIMCSTVKKKSWVVYFEAESLMVLFT